MSKQAKVTVEVALFEKGHKSDYCKVRVDKGMTISELTELLDQAADNDTLRLGLLTIGRRIINLGERAWSKRLKVQHWSAALDTHFATMLMAKKSRQLTKMDPTTKIVSPVDPQKPLGSFVLKRNCTIGFFASYFCDLQEEQI